MSRSTKLRTLRLMPVLLLIAFLQVLSPASLLAGVQPDPECEQACHDTYVTCYYDICDQRGDCSYCWTDYQSCVSYCPQICVEPRSVEEWTVTTTIATPANPPVQQCMSAGVNPPSKGYWYQKHTKQDKNDRYRRTVQCNGTETTVLVSTTYTNTNFNCWKRVPNTPLACTAQVPPPTCIIN
jgi:hypothetical protein